MLPFPAVVGRPGVEMIELQSCCVIVTNWKIVGFTDCPDLQWTLGEKEIDFCCVKPLGCGVVCYCSITSLSLYIWECKHFGYFCLSTTFKCMK